MITTEFTLLTIAPFRLDLTVWTLRRRQKNTVDQWDGQRYTRVLVFDNQPVMLSITQSGRVTNPRLNVTLLSQVALPSRTIDCAKSLVQTMLGLNTDLRPFYRLVANDAALSPLVTQFTGVKPPRFPSIFEALINAIACQQVSLDVGILVLNRLADNFGQEITVAGTELHAFPRPEDLLDAPEEAIKKLGFSYQKVRAIKRLSYGIASGDIDLEHLEASNNEAAVTYLSSIHGIGRWSAEYVLLRGLGRLDTLPGDDVSAQKNLQQLLALENRPVYDEIKQLKEAWEPFAGLVYFHLLLDKLHAKGLV